MIDPDIRDDAGPGAANDRTLRQFAALCGVVLGAAAARDLFARGAILRGSWFGLAALVVMVAGALRPGTIRPLFAAAMAIATPMRIVVSKALLAIVYYGIFTPLAVLFRMIGRDGLVRRRRGDVATYWAPKAMPTDPKSYFRQS